MPNVYKYVPASTAKMILEANRLRFTQPSCFNDPFEFNPSLTLWNKKRIEKGIAKTTAKYGKGYTVPGIADPAAAVQEFLENRINQASAFLNDSLFLVLCVSRPNDSLLMWAHYASNHTGCVIGFDVTHQFFSPGHMCEPGLQPVCYSATRYVLPENGFESMSESEMIEGNKGYSLTKSEEWAYEQELRLLAWPAKASATVAGTPPMLLYDFPPEMVTEITFGARINTADRDEIVSIAERKYPRAVLSHAMIDDDRFALRFMPYAEFKEREARLAHSRPIADTIKVTFPSASK